MLEGAVFLDCGTDLGSAHHVPGESSLSLGYVISVSWVCDCPLDESSLPL